MKIYALSLKASLFTSVFILSILNFSCKKDKEQEKPISNLLTDKIWKQSLTDSNPSSNPPGNVLYLSSEDCAADNTIKFANDGKCFYDLGSLKCQQSEVQKVTGEYAIDLVNKRIILDGVTFTLFELSEDQLKYGHAVQNGGFDYVVYLYKH